MYKYWKAFKKPIKKYAIKALLVQIRFIKTPQTTVVILVQIDPANAADQAAFMKGYFSILSMSLVVLVTNLFGYLFLEL